MLSRGAASGGVWKTVDDGAHWEAMFDAQDVQSIGALAVAASDPSKDTALNILIREASAALEEWCGRTFGRNTYTEYYSGDNDAVLALRQRPVSTTGLRIWFDDTGYAGQGPNASSSSRPPVSTGSRTTGRCTRRPL